MNKYIAVYLVNGVVHTALRMNKVQPEALWVNITKSNVERKIPDQENPYHRIPFL